MMIWDDRECGVCEVHRPGDTIQCCAGVRFITVGAHLLGGEREVESKLVIAQ